MPVQGKGRNRQSSNAVAELDIEILTANMKKKKNRLQVFFTMLSLKISNNEC